MTGPSLKRVTILGESPLVEEYASLCHNKGFDVSVRLNREYAQVKLPKGFKKISKVTRSVDVALELTNISHENKKANVIELDKSLSPKTLIISSSVTVSAAEQSTWISHPERLVGVGALPSLLSSLLIELAPSFATQSPFLVSAGNFARELGKDVAIVRDSVGLVLPRILCMLTNEACFALTENVAGGQDIDMAMKLGTNYPKGPIEWGEKIGIRQIRAVLQALFRHFGEDRYRVAPLLDMAAIRNSLASMS